jgi:PAS domain S-box-containing protein
MHAMIETAVHGIIGIDERGLILFFNPAAEQLFGYATEEVIGQNVSLLMPSPHRERHDRYLATYLATGKNKIIGAGQDLIAQRRDGSTFPIELVVSEVLLSGRRLFTGLVHDITVRKQREEQLRYQANVLANVSDAVIATDINFRVTSWNKAAATIYGCSAKEALGKPLMMFYRTDYIERNQKQVFSELFQKEFWTGEVIQHRKDGSAINVLASVSLLKNSAGEPVGAVAINRDITAQKIAEKALLRERALLAERVAERTGELSAANAELARAVRTKDEFLANMSHELRTPLTSILGLSEALQEELKDFLEQRQLKALETIEKSGQHLLMLINNILDLSKIEAGKINLQQDELSVEDICHTSLLFIKKQAQAKQLRVSFSYNRAIKTIYADARRLKQILVNLLSNAVKFTPPGGAIGLEVNREGSAIHLTVWDTGIGITSEQMRHLFRPFIQVDGSFTRPYQGTGLGLALVARLTELHGGSVSLESEFGKGSRFTISLPSQKAALAPSAVEALPAQAAEINKSGHLILLAEDNEANIFTISTYLETKGYRVIVARNGREAIKRTGEERPALIVMDIQMPEMDGLEAVRRLRADGFAEIPIIALTALAMTGDRERCLAAGVNEYLTKPVSLKRLVRLIAAKLEEKSKP